MTTALVSEKAREGLTLRLAGRYVGSQPGPAVVCFGGLHGNEPLGVVALERVVRQLEKERPAFRGELLALRGNLAALARGSRYVHEDLNRIWTEDRLQALRAATDLSEFSSEAREQREILQLIDDLFARCPGEKYFVDLHTTSAASPPFAVLGDTLKNRAFAQQFPVAVILGLEEQVDGALLEYAHSLGAVTYGFEAGRHDDPTSAQRHEAVVWLALAAAGCIDADSPRLAERRSLLGQACGFPRALEVRYRCGIEPEDHFQMKPGFVNFQPVRRGQPLATNRKGVVRASENGLILMPLYQSQGSDGFFIVREVRPFWLTLSRWLRKLSLESLLPWLPGVRKHPTKPKAVLVNPRVARFFPVEIFHLLGYRRLRSEGGLLVMSRRAFD